MNGFSARISSGFKTDSSESKQTTESHGSYSKRFGVEEKELSACPVWFMY